MVEEIKNAFTKLQKKGDKKSTLIWIYFAAKQSFYSEVH